jgi:MFS transporter, Spinster family, sphingosine-1-phosphate transporter
MQESTYKKYLLYLLMVILAFNQLDRIALGIVLQDVKTDLSLTDTQLGFVTGIAFAFFYAIMGIPIARWADRGNRVTIISLTIAIWSITVALCGLAMNFAQLMFLRIAVAVGEAGCMPPAHSLIADEFSRADRPRAVSRYMIGVPLALTLGYFVAGWLNEFYGWRRTFLILGLPGILLAALARTTLREPRRSRPAPTREATEAEPRLREVYSTLWSNPAFRHLLMCFSVWFFFAYGILQWLPAFFIRSHGMKTGELGSWFAVIWGLGGALGVYLGGEWAVRRAAGNERQQLRGCAIAFSFFAVLTAAAFLARDRYWAFGALLLAAIGGNLAQGPLFATTQTLVPPRMRAMSIALVYLFANLIGMGLGPLFAGVLSDELRPWLGEESLRYALVALCPGYFWAAWHMWRAGNTVARDLEGARRADAVTARQVPSG